MKETTPTPRAGVRPWLVAILLLLALVVGGAIGAVLAQTPQLPPYQPASGPACPSAARHVTWPSPPTLVVRFNPPSSAPAPVILRPSQTLEIDLYGHWTWQLRTPQVAPTLAVEAPAGYLDDFVQSCVWRFTAQQAGDEQLQFFGNGMCQGATATCVAAFFTLRVTVSIGT
jgi:hypothetical protein